jgi:hypothetical protein
MPIAYMTVVDGWAHARWGAAGLLNIEAAFGVVGIIVFIAVAMTLLRRALLASPKQAI